MGTRVGDLRIASLGDQLVEPRNGRNAERKEGPERIRATYGGNNERLRKVKAKYDPDNFFHVNQNIKLRA